jgi:hypothetical protein
MWRFLAFSLLVAYLTSSRMRVVLCSFTKKVLGRGARTLISFGRARLPRPTSLSAEGRRFFCSSFAVWIFTLWGASVLLSATSQTNPDWCLRTTAFSSNGSSQNSRVC